MVQDLVVGRRSTGRTGRAGKPGDLRQVPWYGTWAAAVRKVWSAITGPGGWPRTVGHDH